MSENNLSLYAKMKDTPAEAKKQISAGRLRGFTDIKPMYRIKKLTEEFGICGFGWKYEITSQRLELAPTGEIKAFVDVNLYIKMNGEWSDPIPGIGGNAFLSHEKGGDYVNDECFKSALSDAIGTACKSIGMCADVYYAEDRTKYTKLPDTNTAINEKSHPAPAPAEQAKDASDVDGMMQTIGNVIDGITDIESANYAVEFIAGLAIPEDRKGSVQLNLTRKTASLGLVYSARAKSFVRR